jgi:hypothetical protein
MKLPMHFTHRSTMIFIAASALFHWAAAQNASENATKSASASCSAARAIISTDLHGVWSVELGTSDSAVPSSPSSSPQRGLVRFEQNPEYEDSIAGWLELGDAKLFVAGDIDEGQFSLEESDDGKRISAVWEGSITEDSCGKAITGSRRVGEKISAFVLRKTSGWR